MVLGPVASYLESVKASGDRFRVISTQIHSKLKPDRVIGAVDSSLLEVAIGYWFRDYRHLQDALSQQPKEASRQGLPCQRLEYLGDAFIEIFVVEHWMRALPNCNASSLATLHTQCTNRGFLSAPAANICLEKHIFYDTLGKSQVVCGMIEGLVLAKWEDKMKGVQTTYWDRVNTKDKTLFGTFE
ncbi:hypothetical protein BGZ46_008657, partial [Entomortierella lignicola]